MSDIETLRRHERYLRGLARDQRHARDPFADALAWALDAVRKAIAEAEWRARIAERTKGFEP